MTVTFVPNLSYHPLSYIYPFSQHRFDVILGVTVLYSGVLKFRNKPSKVNYSTVMT